MNSHPPLNENDGLYQVETKHYAQGQRTEANPVLNPS